jgi:hypothetical protein
MLAAALLFPAARGQFQGATHMMPFDEETISYSKTKDTGPIGRLQQRLDNGQCKLAYDPKFGFLPALLKELGISPTSQMLVFSKTSFQRERISPQTPRALYFNDNTYVGFIPGAPLLEVSVADPQLGGVFYTLQQKASESGTPGEPRPEGRPAEHPRFVRTDQCLECHASATSLGVPGHLVRSFVTDDEGVVDLITGVSPVTDRTPMKDRWGGWYVSGTHGGQTHRGNLIGPAAFQRQEKEPNYMGNIADLSRFFDTSRYVRPTSDIVALMVLEHQTHMHNFITRLHYAAELALQQYGHVRYLNSVTESFLQYLLFTEESPLTAPVKGTSGFTEWFAGEGPKDHQGRSLRQFDLQTRLFKYPCSYLIYSEAFDALPEPIKDKLYRRLWDILTGHDSSAAFAKIPAESRRAVREILIETKPNLPEYWRKAG